MHEIDADNVFAMHNELLIRDRAFRAQRHDLSGYGNRDVVSPPRLLGQVARRHQGADAAGADRRNRLELA